MTDAHKEIVRANGKAGGNPPGPRVPPLSPEELERTIDHTAALVIQGKVPRNAQVLRNAITEHDRIELARFTNITANEFTDRLATKLRALADLTADRIQQKLSDDRFKPHELSFLMTVVVDKIQRLEGRSQVTGANVNVQINNFGPAPSKADIIARLTGQSFDVPALAVAEDQAAYQSHPEPVPVPAFGSESGPAHAAD